MPRTRPADRLDELLDAALHVFLALGYRRARMSDVAAAAGVSPGLLYTYAAGKEALFSLVVRRELGEAVDAIALPVPNPEPGDLERLVVRGVRGIARNPVLEAAEAVDDPADAAAELATVVGEIYDSMHRYRRFIRVVERSAVEWPELAEHFYERGRRPLVRRLARFIARRCASGHYRPVPDPEVAARYVVEIVAWFANHRYGDHDGARIDDAIARETVVQLVTRGFVG
ncbi:MAG: hypothetical protein KatS3mg009_1099 [Acidimicrobiia bacterium]|nr:MAG: hypothetical protein KatS3mg009_1099 [Acidimicrobiia bacterium]